METEILTMKVGDLFDIAELGSQVLSGMVDQAIKERDRKRHRSPNTTTTAASSKTTTTTDPAPKVRAS